MGECVILLAEVQALGYFCDSFLNLPIYFVKIVSRDEETSVLLTG